MKRPVKQPTGRRVLVNILDRRDREIASLKISIRELLDAYWGQGDGDTPPEFIQRAATLSGWVYPWQATKPAKGNRPCM